MPIVNYVREHIRFMEYACDEKVTASERLLWYALMHVMNQRAQGNVWPEDFIRISNDRLLSLCPMRFDTLAKARNGLKQRGLIDFINGDKNKRNPAYRMVYFCPEYMPSMTDAGTREQQECYPEISDNNRDNIRDNNVYNMGDNNGDNSGGNSGDIYINYRDTNRYPYSNSREEDDKQEDEPLSYAQARDEAEIAWIQSFGKKTTPAILNRLALWAKNAQVQAGVLREAVRIAAERSADSPFDYLMTMLSDWARHNLHTEADIDEYMLLYDTSRGRLSGSGLTPQDAMTRLKEFRNRGTNAG